MRKAGVRLQGTKVSMLRTLGLLMLIFGCIACNGNSAAISPAASPLPPTSTPLLPALEPTPEKGEFIGYYVSSFEVSSFVPCTMSGLPGYGNGYWLEASPGSGFYEQYATFVPTTSQLGLPEDPGTIVFIRVLGEVSAPKNTFGYGIGEPGYGHLNQYPRMITVTKVLEMAPHTNNQCTK